MRITHACSVLAAAAAYVIPATETAASRWRRGSARPAPLHGLFGGGAKEDVAAGLADDERADYPWGCTGHSFSEVDLGVGRRVVRDQNRLDEGVEGTAVGRGARAVGG